jgi:hypothetical protein
VIHALAAQDVKGNSNRRIADYVKEKLLARLGDEPEREACSWGRAIWCGLECSGQRRASSPFLLEALPHARLASPYVTRRLWCWCFLRF